MLRSWDERVARVSDVSTHRSSNDRSLCFIPTDASVIAMTLQSQECAQAQPDVITPRAPGAHLRPLDQAELLDPAVIVLNRPRETRPLDPLQVIHLDFVRRPQFNVAVCGDYLEDADKAVTFEPDDAPRRADLTFTHRAQARPAGVHFPVTLQARQPSPVKRANQLEVFQPRIPAIEDHTSRRKAALMGGLDHCLEVVVLRQGVLLLVEEAIINGHVPVAVRPQKRNEVDAAHDRVVLTRPVARHQLDLLRIRLIQGRVVYDKDALAQADLAHRFSPE